MTLHGGEDASNFETKFQMITTTFTNKQKTYFYLSAAGTFYIDWGDGSEVETITKSTPSSRSYDHSFPAGGPYTIRIGGRATAYVEQTSNYQSACISFYAGRNSRQNLIYHIAEISGSLGAIFPTINSSQPSFNQTFYSASNMDCEIPSTLFSGLSGEFGQYMFRQTFANTSGLHGYIPYNLFADLTPRQSGMNNVMYYTFSNTGLSTTCQPNTTTYCTPYSDMNDNTNYCTSYWNSKVMCKPQQQCIGYYNNQCVEECPVLTTLKTGTGVSIPLTGNKLTTPAINIRKNNTTCYIPLEMGNGGNGTLNMRYNGTTYHAVVIQ